MESTGGFGIDYLALNDKLKLSFEAFDFSSDQDNRSFYGGFAIRFEDDDLKYLLTTTPISK
ncbi:MAG: hypothetical protein C0390_00635 [Syntrophus sp. (in: bacteria)]|nr:hypothetical protein [Syntrophus sp. (in: bacteria)]